MIRYARHALLASLLLGLSACVNFQTMPQSYFTQRTWSQRKAALLAIKAWHITGAFSIKTKKQHEIANYSWQQQGQHYVLNLSAPLDVSSVRIEGKPAGVTLITPDGQTYHAKTAVQLMQSVLGWHAPIANLHYWIRGLPAAGEIVTKRIGPKGHLLFIDQQGWQVTFSRYLSLKGGQDIPQLLLIRGHGFTLKLRASW